MRGFAVFALGMMLWMSAGVQPASALTAELAKKCRAFAVKAHPPKLAGSKTGSAAAERQYFKDCVAKGGHVPEPEAPAPAQQPKRSGAKQ